MAIGDDFEIQLDKDIRHISGSTCYTVLELHRWLQDLADNDAAAGNDYMDITILTPSERSYDTIIQLVNGFNIDDHAARFLYDGSVIQTNGDVIYDGLVVYAPASTSLELIQNGVQVTPNFWGTGLNADASKGISHRMLIKVRTGAADIDGRRVLGQTRKWGKQFSEFLVNGTSRGNNTIAVAAGSDLNNVTAEATIEGYTTISNQEGYRLIDVNNDTTDEPYYSEWNKATYGINTLYERTKWLSAEPRVEDSCADVGSDFTIGNGTITGQAQSLENGANPTWLMHVKVQLKKTGSPTGNAVAKLYANLNTHGGGDDVPTGSALATSVNVDVSKLGTSYETVEFGFTTPYLMSASQDLCIAIEYTGGGVSDYIQVRGLATTGTHSGNRAQKNGSWVAVAADDLNFSLYTVGNLYDLPGNLFRGITHEVALTTPRTGTFNAVEKVTWSGGSGMMVAIDSPGTGTKMWIQVLTGVAPTDTQTITGTESSATATASGTATERDIPGKGALPFFGASTGTAIIGAYGVGVEKLDLSSSDKVFDLTNTLRQAPNYVTFNVNGLVVNEDYIMVGPKAAGNDFLFTQLTLSTSLSGAAETAVVVTTAIPGDTPATGTIRIQLNSGKRRKVSYTSWTGSTFTIPSTDFTGDPATAPKDVMVSYIDKLATSTTESFIGIYVSDRTLWIKNRDGGPTPIKTGETPGTLGTAGGSVTVARIPDA